MAIAFQGPTDALDGYPDAYPNEIRADMTLGGVEAAARKPQLLEAARTRALPAPIAVEADPVHGTVSARLSMRFAIPTGFGRSTPGSVLAMGTAHAEILQRMLETIKGSLEDGERPYERRAFGLWPSRIRWWYQQARKAHDIPQALHRASGARSMGSTGARLTTEERAMSDAPTKPRTRRQIAADWQRDAVMRKLVAMLGPPPPRKDREPFQGLIAIAHETLEPFTIMVSPTTRERFENAADKQRLEAADIMDACLDALLGSLTDGAA